MPFHSMRYRKKRRRITGNSVIHIPSTIAAAPGANTSIVFIISSPSIFADGSASDNIEAQDKDRTVNVGHHIGRINISLSIRNPTASGIMEFGVFKVERVASTPALGVFPIPSSAENNSQGLQQSMRLQNPGKVFHFSQRAYTPELAVVHNITVSPAKYKLSKFKAGDHWVLMIHNRGTAQVTVDLQMRYKEYE